ncbi:hypothetical protein [uncultured Aeromicrobium sp.]|uniref:hypothetical protein n=1 Tax=uncultured Aeromicrobium sp. TaxID=337820 RepID=UPI0025F20E40|nr:hypothetical protein [uncultured Aeromicrobium sp.]
MPTLPLMGMAVVLAPLSVLVIGGTSAAGFALVRVTLTATHPIVRAVRARTDRVG